LRASLTRPTTVGLVSVVVPGAGPVYVTAGGLVSSTKASSYDGDTLPTLSVARRCTVCVPSAVPSSGSAVLKLKLPEASKVTGKVAPASSCPTTVVPSLRASLTRPTTVGLVRVAVPGTGAVYVTAGGLVSSTKVSSKVLETLPT